MKYTVIRDFSRKLRKNQTPFENQLWKRLRHRKIQGYKFLRQHPILYDRKRNDFNFVIPDFYCAEAQLAIEVDGGIHDKTIEKDMWREKVLEGLGIHVLRFRNEELVNMEEVIHQIVTYLSTLPNPSLHAGRGRGWV